MKKVIGLLLTLCASISSAQIVINAGSGGGAVAIGSGTALTACTSSILYADAGSLLKCDPAAVVNGSVTTAGRSILTIRDTITGATAPQGYFQNITGTFPASQVVDVNGISVVAVADGTSYGSTHFQNGVAAAISGGLAGVGSVAVAGNFAATTTGGIGVGVQGTSSAGSNAVGVLGYVTGGTAKAGGIFGLGAVGLGGISALVADNGAVAATIIDARDNGVSVWSVADNGYIQGTMGEVALNANYTNATAGFTSTALSVAVVSGRTYSFDLNLMFADSTAADGAQFDFNGGSAAATNFDVHCTAANNVGAALAITNAASTTLATAVQVALALTTQAALTCHGSFVPSGSGTFIVRGAQTAHTAGTLTINRGSSLSVRDSRPL